jgi:hypothetical protein
MYKSLFPTFFSSVVFEKLSGHNIFFLFGSLIENKSRYVERMKPEHFSFCLKTD